MSDPAAGRPHMFTRVFDTPPGAPWDQARAARLDAELGAPMPLTALRWSLRRLSPWRPNTSGRYAVAYLRREDAKDPATQAAVIDGATVTFAFGGGLALGQPRQLAPIAASLAAGLLLAGAATHALGQRTERDAQFSRLELNAQKTERLSRVERRQEADASAIRRAGLEGRSFANLSADLAWLAQAKSGGVALRSITWTPDNMEVVSEGEAQPVQSLERTVERAGGAEGGTRWLLGAADKPVLRNGVARPSVVSRPPGSRDRSR